MAAMAACAACLLMELSGPAGSVRAQTATATDANSNLKTGVFALAGQINRDTYGVYLVDPQNSTLTLYQWMPDVRRLKLLASRNYGLDARLDEYNTEPALQEIKQIVENARRVNTATTQP